MRRNSRGTDRRGVAAVEAALTMPIVVVLLLGTWEVGRMVEVQQLLDNATREGARQAASGQLTNAQVQQAVTNYLNNAKVTTTHLVVTVNDLTAPGTDASVAAVLDQIQVTTTMPFSDVRWTAAVLVGITNTQMSSQAIWCSSNAQSYPSSITVPPGY
jgi:Flp pilus assembly protein TadG